MSTTDSRNKASEGPVALARSVGVIEPRPGAASRPPWRMYRWYRVCLAPGDIRPWEMRRSSFAVRNVRHCDWILLGRTRQVDANALAREIEQQPREIIGRSVAVSMDDNRAPPSHVENQVETHGYLRG